MSTSEIHLPAIQGTEGSRDKTVTLSALVDFFMVRNSNIHRNRDHGQNTSKSLLKHLPSRGTRVTYGATEGKQSEYTLALKGHLKMWSEEQAVFMHQISHVTDRKRDDELSENSYKSMKSVQSPRSFPEHISQKKWIRGFGGFRLQYNKQAVNFSPETKRVNTIDLSITGICCPTSWAHPITNKHKKERKLLKMGHPRRTQYKMDCYNALNVLPWMTNI